MTDSAQSGKVYLVGAGPGDPGLLTLRAREVIDTADAIVYDSRRLSNLLPADARERGHPELYFVGRSRIGKRPSLERVNELLSSLARSGKSVARLVLGDPFLLGGGSEEGQHLNDYGIDFEIVAGVPEGVAAAAYAGIPLTHGEMSKAVVFLDSRKFPNYDTSLGALALATQTIVIGPGVKSLEKIAEELIEAGIPRDMPAATIKNAGTPHQRVIGGTIETIAALCREARISGRAITVVGYSVVLRDELDWRERSALFGKRVALADPPSISGQLVRMLRALGADVTEMPEQLSQRLHVEWQRDALDLLAEFDWLVFSGADAVAVFWEKLLGSGRDARALASRKIAAVGAPTVRALLERGITVDATPAKFDVDDVTRELESRNDIAGARFLVVTTEEREDRLMAALAKAGGAVEVITAARLVPNERALARWKRRITGRRPDVVAFTSVRSVDRFIEVAGDKLGAEWTSVSISGGVSDALRERGFEPAEQAQEPTLASLVEAIRRALT